MPHRTSNLAAWKSIPRTLFPFRMNYQTRFSDNDAYGHMNCAQYYSIQDSIINTFMIRNRVLVLPSHQKHFSNDNNNNKISDSILNSIGICAENSFRFYDSVSYPQELDVGLCVTHIGRVSVTYRVGIYVCNNDNNDIDNNNNNNLKGLGKFVHIFCDKETMKPLKELPVDLHKTLSTLLVDEPK